MKIYPILTVFAFTLFSVSMRADTFDFSYTFNDGVTTAKGTITGTQVGDCMTGTVTDVAVQTLYIDGLQITSPLFASKYDPSVGYVAGPIVSFDGMHNDFRFDTSDLADGVYGTSGVSPAGDFFLDTMIPPIYGFDTQSVVDYVDFAGVDIGTQNLAFGTWKLTKVPDSGTTLSLLGFTLIGLIALRRRKESRG